MAACKNLLCVNSFTEANRKACFRSLKTNWDGEWQNKRLWTEEFVLYFYVWIRWWRPETYAQNTKPIPKKSLWSLKDKPSQSSNVNTLDLSFVLSFYLQLQCEFSTLVNFGQSET